MARHQPFLAFKTVVMPSKSSANHSNAPDSKAAVFQPEALCRVRLT
jgi:hypothetical protein